ncbi:MAG: prepilin-type N-terminal cleavage/methylation domain-containing protein, partial [Candidatus Palauibacterales bacterium]|nr:prepilin-type N-terminal cleavage/methylation domain-containing protein [Candidatus Palauibacterales bacterium]
MRDRRGFTLVEIVIVIVLIALMSAFAIPRISTALVKQNVRSARVAITTLHAKARAYAIQRARQVALVTRNNEIYLISMTPVTDVVDTINAPVNLNDRYGVT